ncbi:Calcium channel YVC1 [Vanrija pseudolonga]|uniref:Calcium channel YVC1 n=1 Tax=Vanrija pseudolonga TaxID=143232 RepID=A0AAF0YGG7_9TREE|nr:Calcium channel YVC1 [Vanrija pseudolonga]
MTTPASGTGAEASGAVVVSTTTVETTTLAAPSSPLVGAGFDPEDEGTSVFELVHTLHATITAAIDTPMTWDELKSPSVNYTLVKPIVQRFKPTEDDDDDNDGHSLGGVLYAIFANRVQFINLADEDLSYAPLQSSRALFCELLAIKILRTSPTVQDEAELCSELVRAWSALEGAPDTVIASLHDGERLVKTRTSALDLAIVSGSKKFLSQPLVQHLITLIYDGDLIYSPVSSHALIADSLSNPAPKRRRRGITSTEEHEEEEEESQPVEVYAYNPYKAGWLDYQRLRVPRWRRWIEFLSLTILITLFLLTLSTRRVRHPIHFTNVEILFIAYTFGFILDEFAASKEHGLAVYLASVWNTFDLTFIGIFLTYLFLRLRSLATHDPATADLGYDILSLGACILFPRLAFILIQDNVVLLALRGMIATFFGFMALIAIAFSGIFFCLWTMGKEKQIRTGRIFGLMFSTWFGGSSSVFGFERVPPEEIHPTLGPGVLFAYALLCGLFLVPMLTSLLSNKFSAVRSNANEEYLFQRVVTTVEGVKSDAIFSYLPPFNIAALVILLPLGEFASPQTLHNVNVFLIRLTNFPLLFLISAYERSRYRALRRAVRLGERGVHPEYKNSWTDTFLGGGAQSVIRAAFEVAPPVVKQETPPASESPSKAGADVKPGKDTLAPAAKNGKDKAAPPPLPLAASKPAGRPLESPLGRLFRQERSGATVTVTAEEWAEVRDSQKRLEEMLDKLLAVSGAAK